MVRCGYRVDGDDMGLPIKENKPLISVVVPIYNVEDTLPECLRSIESQSLASLEIICINDGSTDHSLNIALNHAERDGRFVVVNQDNSGYGAACNKGIELARGEWVSIIEPDDWISPSMYEAMVAFASSFYEKPDIVKTPWFDVWDWDDVSTARETVCTLSDVLKTSSKPFVLKDAPELIEQHPSIWSALYRRKYLLDSGVRFPEYSGAGWADNPFLIDSLGRARSIVYLNRPFYHYRRELAGVRKPDIPYAKMAMPFMRWKTMLDQLKSLDLDCPELLSAHYYRGFNNAVQIIRQVGLQRKGLEVLVRDMFSRMDDDIVAGHPKLGRKYKRFYFEMLGKPCPYLPAIPRVAYLLREVPRRLARHW